MGTDIKSDGTGGDGCVFCPHAGLCCETVLSVMYDAHGVNSTWLQIFNCCNLVWNSYLSHMSAELSANVCVLRYLLLFRDNQDTCYHPFETDEIAIAINCICTVWFADIVCVFLHFMLFICVAVFTSILTCPQLRWPAPTRRIFDPSTITDKILTRPTHDETKSWIFEIR